MLLLSGAMALKLHKMADAEAAFSTLLRLNPDHNEYHYRFWEAKGWVAPAGMLISGLYIKHR